MPHRNKLIREVDEFLRGTDHFDKSVYERVWSAVDEHVLQAAGIGYLVNKVRIDDSGVIVSDIQSPELAENALDYFIEKVETQVGLNINWHMRKNKLKLTVSSWENTDEPE